MPPGIRESVDRASTRETTRKGEKRFTETNDDEKRLFAKKKETRFVSPRARHGSVLARVFFVRFSRRSSSLRISRGSPVFVTAAKLSRGEARGRRTARVFTLFLKSKKKNRTNEPRRKKKSEKSKSKSFGDAPPGLAISRALRGAAFVVRPWVPRGTPP